MLKAQKNNISFNLTQDVNEIMSPIMLENQLTYFAFKRNFPNKTFINLVTDLTWTNYNYFEKNTPPSFLLNYDDVTDSFITFNKNTYLFKDQTYEDITDLNQRFGLFSTAVIVKKFDHFLDVIGFTTSAPDPHSFMLNNIDALESYYFYFKDKAQNIISQSSRDPLIYHNNDKANHVNNISMRSATLNQYVIELDNSTALLTKREYHVLHLLAKGSSSKLIARALNISPRTVEHHISKIAKKTLCNTRHKMAEVFWNNKLTLT